MRCIFCKENSSNSKSVEHIIPESLGNTEHILPPGIVCDRCNNYFAIKVEKPLLDSHYFLHTRFENLIPNKKGRIPTVKGLHPLSHSIVDVEVKPDEFNIYLEEKDIGRFMKTTSQGGRLYLPTSGQPENIDNLLSRFLTKAALEVLAIKALHIPKALEADVIDHQALDPIRNYARRGSTKLKWSFHKREIYPADAVFYSEEEGVYYDVPHEFTLLYTDNKELFFIVAIFGIEYALNMGNPDISTYLDWLNNNDNRSPLYMEGLNYSFTHGKLAGLDKGSIIRVFSR